MDEYFCPNCNAVLNYQFGFDPDNGSWTCTECGQFLMDNDTYSGESYEGVAWFCDCCNALLNKQFGFSDTYNFWTCTECSFLNKIDESEIIEPVHTCPNCNSNLKNQWEYNEYETDYLCSECNTELHRDYSEDEFSIVSSENICPNCDVSLLKQSGYSDLKNQWICAECSAKLYRDYFYQIFSVESNSELYNQDDEVDFGASDFFNSSSNNLTSELREPSFFNSSNLFVEHTEKISTKEIRKKRMKAFLFKKKKIAIDFSTFDLLGIDGDEAYVILYNAGFKNISKILLDDIDENSIIIDNSVQSVEIDGNTNFSSNDMLPYDSNVVITIHKKKKITLPFSMANLKKTNYQDVYNQFRSLGFSNILYNEINDLIVGWIIKNGSVEKVTINDELIKKNSVYTFDARVVIFYHAKK